LLLLLESPSGKDAPPFLAQSLLPGRIDCGFRKF